MSNNTSKYYTEGYIAGVEKTTDEKTKKEKFIIKFHPTPPFLFEEGDAAFCLIKSKTNGSAKLIKCDSMKQIELPNIGIDGACALMLLGTRQKLRIEAATSSIRSFTDWKTL